MENTPLTVAKRLIGTKEIAGVKNNPFVVWCLSTCGLNDAADEVPWCSAFVNGICFLTGVCRSMLANARSWLDVGEPIKLEDAKPGFDIIIFKRGDGPQPGPEVKKAPGHVAFFLYRDGEQVWVIGGNQGDKVSTAAFPIRHILGVRRLSYI